MAPPRGGEQALDIFDVVADRPAAAAGLRAGDRIVSVNGTAVSQLAPGQFETAMRASPLTLGIRRGEEELSFTLTLGG
jgi:C-terminal processing protease CtpA/Prc